MTFRFAPDPRHLLGCRAAIGPERLAWYVILPMLALWLPRMGFTTKEAAGAAGTLLLGAYLLPLLGALAGRLLGLRRAVLGGIALMGAGYAALGLGRPVLGLCLVAMGAGLFKPNLTALVGGAYPSASPEQRRAYGKFYAAINWGALPAGPLGAWLLAGGPARFGALSGLCALSLGAVLLFWRPLGAGERRSEPEALLQEDFPTYRPSRPPLAALLRQLGVLGLLLLGATVFWFAYNQSFVGLSLWTDKYVDRRVLGWEVPTLAFSSLNALFIILLEPAVARLEGLRVGLPHKLVAGMLLLAAGFLALWLPGRGASCAWLVLAYALISAAELLVSAACMAAVMGWAPRGWGGLWQALWFCSIGAGGWLAGRAGGAEDLRQLFGLTALAALGGGAWFLLSGRLFAREEARAAQAVPA